MIRTTASRLAFAFALMLVPVLPASAFDVSAMSDDERTALHAEIRAYLLENPEVIFEAVAVFEERQAATQNDMDVTLVQINAEAIFDDGHSWVGGNPEGDVTLVEFSDYRCGFCQRAFPEIMELLESDGNIRFILKELPILGAQSELAARYAISVKQAKGDDAYFETHQALMTFRGDITPDSLLRLSGTLGFDHEPIAGLMNSRAIDEIIDENRALAQRLRVSGTPTFVLEDEMIRGFVPADVMELIISDIRGG